MVVPIFLSLDRLDSRLLEAAGDLGASPWRAFWNVTLPLSMPGVVGGVVMVFIAAFGAYVTPKLIGGSSGIMFGNVLADQYSGTFNWPFGAVLALIMISVVLLLVVDRQPLQPVGRSVRCYAHDDRAFPYGFCGHMASPCSHFSTCR